MKQSDLVQLKREVLDHGPDAALPCNLPDKWLALLGRDLEMLPHEQGHSHSHSHSYLSAPLAIVVQLLLGKSGRSEGSFSEEELEQYLRYLEIEIAIEVVRRSADIDATPATIETIFTNRVAYVNGRRVKRAKLLGRSRQSNTIKRERCLHDWQRDGQTMTAMRWTCTKCGKSELRA